MKPIAWFFLFLPLWASAQHTDFSFSASAGRFRFRGPGWTGTTGEPSYGSSDTYSGKERAFSYAFALQGERVTKGGWLLGLSGGFDVLTSQTRVDTLSGGREQWELIYVTLRPFVGHRWTGGGWRLDVDAGVDFAFCQHSQVMVSDPAHEIWEVPGPRMDLRPRLELGVGYKCLGVFAAYALGLTNDQTLDQTQGAQAVYADFLQAGIRFTFPYPATPSSRSGRK